MGRVCQRSAAPSLGSLPGEKRLAFDAARGPQCTMETSSSPLAPTAGQGCFPHGSIFLPRKKKLSQLSATSFEEGTSALRWDLGAPLSVIVHPQPPTWERRQVTGRKARLRSIAGHPLGVPYSKLLNQDPICTGGSISVYTRVASGVFPLFNTLKNCYAVLPVVDIRSLGLLCHAVSHQYR